MGEGNFGGDGSVRWRIRSRDHKVLANNDPLLPGPNKKNFGGADKDHGTYFVIKLKCPAKTNVNQFWTQLVSGGISIDGDYLVMQLPIESQEGTPKQIIVSWDKEDVQPGSKEATTKTPAAPKATR